ncbi:hypothetical protein Ancab_032055 [Ancistrocladus abbreviatus]
MGRLAVALTVTIWVVPVSILVNRIVPEPYMDEIFHVPQAQQYCEGNFKSWDPMITTPPGLYYLSLAHVASLFPGMLLLQWASSILDVCSTAILRSINGVLAIICGILIHDIIVQLRPTLDRRKATFYAVVLALYPLHWFFTYLYYTDVASLTAFLAMYLACLKKNYWLSAWLGALAVFIRQTNIIWMLFVACSGVIDITLNQQTNDVSGASFREKGSYNSNDDSTTNIGLRKRKFKKPEIATNHAVPQKATISRTQDSGLMDEIQILLVRSWNLKRELFTLFAPFLFVLVAFIAFVRWNGSIVLGAKEAHTMSLHFAQMLYFSLASVLASAPLHFTPNHAAVILSSFWKSRPFDVFLRFLALAAGLLSVHFFSIAHPYLLADNRHYLFYLWRKVVKTHWSIKYLLVPLYIYSWLSIVNIFGKACKRIWVLAYFLACAAVLVPAPLIEFRYYTIPFYIFMLHSQIDEDRKHIFMAILYIAVNVFTLSMFLFRPFQWDHEPGMQRFIW